MRECNKLRAAMRQREQIAAERYDPLAVWTGEYSRGGEMIFQMLSRGTYTRDEIARFIGCPVEAVTIVACTRKSDIERNHRDFLKTMVVCKRVLESPTRTGYPARPSNCLTGYMRNVKIFDGTYRRNHLLSDENRRD